MTQASLRATAAADSHAAEEPVLVFESNLAGQHGKGTSFLAEKCHGAVAGKGWGLQGSSYAIPVFDKDLMPVSATILSNYVQSFLKHAESTPQQRFRVTALGFGNPNISQAELVKMFARAPSNCMLPGRWLELLSKLDSVRLIILDAAGALSSEKVQQKLDDYFSINAPLWTSKAVEIVSAGSPQSTMANDQYARARKYRHRIVNVNESFYRNYLNQAREDMAVWYSTRILNIAEPDQTSQGSTLRILQSAIRAGLEIEDITLGEQF
ncbi:MAG: hypothetical protein U1F34_03025 [Gammaproteobacteria bacterium]